MQASPADVIAPALSAPPVTLGQTATAQLTLRLKAGEESAWREFHEAYCHRLLRYLLVVTRGDEELARNAVQGAFVRAVRHVRRFDTEPAFWSWLTMLALSALRDERRKHRRYLAFLDRWFAWITSAPEPTPPQDTGEELEQLLKEALVKLPPPDVRLIERKYFEEQSVREIALGLGCSEKAVESRLSRLRARLKDLILLQLRDAPVPKN